MKRIGILGLAALAALAITAVASVATASARTGFATESYPAAVESEPKDVYIYDSFGYVRCSGSFYGEASSPSTSLATIMTGTNCKTSLGNAASLKFNGCSFVFTPGAEVEGGQFAGQFGVGPAKCGKIVLTYSIFGVECVKSFSPQTKSGVSYTNLEGVLDRVEVGLDGTQLAYTEANPKSFCGSATGSVEIEDSLGDMKFTAWRIASGSPQNLQIASSIPVSVGEEGFSAEAYPAYVLGEQTSMQTIAKLTGNELRCNQVKFSGKLAEASSSLTLSPTYSDCQMIFLFALNATVQTNGCQYVFHSVGTMDIVCPKEKAIEISVPAVMCSIRIGPQTGLSGVTYKGSGAEISLSLGLSGIAYTVPPTQPLICGKDGTEGTASGSSLLYAFL